VTITAEGGTVRYWGSLDTTPDPDQWTVTAASSVPNPAGGAPLTHTVSARLEVVVPIAGNEAWNYVFSDSPACTVVQNIVVIGAPMYTKGDLCLKNQAAAIGPMVDVYGGIQLEDFGRVGTAPSDASDPAVRSRLGCRNGSSGGFNVACSSASYLVYRSSYSNATPNLTKPPFDAGKRTTAKPGPLQPCTVATGSVPSFTSTGLIDLMPGSSYTCQVWQDGVLAGELSWNDLTKLLTVKGTIWFDGELMINSTQLGMYDGRAAIYFAGKATIQNQAQLCAVAGCPASGWDPNSELLVLLSGASDVPAFEIKDQAMFQGAVYAVGGFKLQDQGVMHGPVVASVVDVQNNGFPAGWPGLTSLFDGMPSNTGGKAIYVPGSWRG
jgi:hypothetical protein